ncbi:MAG TPA: site-specific integrase [Puia sp.]|nr:site-specific integrase [Puia sp.]
MDVSITPRPTRNGQKIYYTLEWGKGPGERSATGIYTYVKPKDQLQRNYNKEALATLETKRAQLVLERQAIGTGIMPTHKFKANFLDYFGEFVENNKQAGNRHLEGCFAHFKKFLGKSFLSPIDVTENLCERFRKYLLDKFNGDTPANYFSRLKRVAKAATKEGYFRINPADDVAAKSNKNRKRKEFLEVPEYLALLRTPCIYEDLREAFILCCYTGMRWCDVKPLDWKYIGAEAIVFYIIQEKTAVEHRITLHPIAKAILEMRRRRLAPGVTEGRVFKLSSQDRTLRALDAWCKAAGIQKHITWHSARLSFSILLQDANVDTATVALLLGQTSTKYVNEVYKRHRPKDQSENIRKLPDAPVYWLNGTTARDQGSQPVAPNPLSPIQVAG